MRKKCVNLVKSSRNEGFWMLKVAMALPKHGKFGIHEEADR